jgi:CheY-like chemotaxis protein
MPSVKSILYFEDDPQSLRDYCSVLRSKYKVVIGADRHLIEQHRQHPVDLVIIDLLIHHHSLDEEENPVENVRFPQVNWKRTGVEFLRRLRAGDYEEFGLSAAVPVVIATAAVDYSVQHDVMQLGPNAYLEKPFTIDQLEEAIDAVLGSGDG